MRSEYDLVREISLGKFAFYWQVADSGFDELPAELSFSFGVQKALPYLLRRLFEQSDLDILRAMYGLESNVGYLQESNSLGMLYARDLLRKIAILQHSSGSAFSRNPIPRVLEIGCGGAVVLRSLANQHISCVGIDPSPISVEAIQDTEIELICDFFPNQLNGEKFDFIYHADVLEHIEDPLDFLRSCGDHLVDEGLLLVSVPDCTRSIRMGDVSMALHQHLSYFDEESLRRVLQEAGFVDVSVERAAYGGSLYGIGKKPRWRQFREDQNRNLEQVLNEFFQRASTSVTEVETLFKRSLQAQESVGVYVPLRALPYLGRSNELRQLVSSFRLFDDTPTWRGKRIQQSLSRIEDFSQFLENPVDHLFIMSLTFGETIAQKVTKSIGYGVKIETLEALIT